MKKLLLATVGVVAMATTASAADLPARMPVKAPPYVAPLYNWTGFYIGGHLGWARVDLDQTLLTTAAPFAAGTTLGRSDDGFLYGGQLGFNWQAGAWVFGIEGELSGVDIGSSGTATGVVAGVPVTVNGSAGIDWIASVTGRVGYAFGPLGNILVYAKGGIAWMDWSACASGTAGGVFFTGGCGGGTETGWTLGAGLEWGFAPNWSAKIEYQYYDFDDQRVGFVGGPLVGAAVSTDLTTQVVKVGVNYRFGGWFR